MIAGDRLDWVDEFISRIRPYVTVRLRDNVLIRMPNNTYKLNPTGARLLDYLLRGGRLEDILTARSEDPESSRQITQFFCDLRLLLSSGFCDRYSSPSLIKEPFELGYIEYPILSEVAVTNRCNINCAFCYASCRCTGSTSREKKIKDLSTDKIKHLLRIIRHDAEVPSVSFTGGEPTLRSDLEKLISYAHRELGMRVNLITNGTLIDVQRAKKLKKAGLASAQVSIESPDADNHDEITGIRGSHDRSVAGLQALWDAGIHVHPHATLCSLNRTSLPGMPRFAGELGMDRFSANLVIPTGRADKPDLAIRYHEVSGIIQEIMENSRHEQIEFMWYSPTPACLFNPIAHGLGNKGCSACEGLLSVDPEGNVLPCSSWNEPVGNLFTDDFEAVWFSSRAKMLRAKKAAHPDCHGCSDFALCHGACPLYFRVHGYDEIEPELARLRKENAA